MRFRVQARAGDERSFAECAVEVLGLEPAAGAPDLDEEDGRPPPPGIALAPGEASVEGGGGNETTVILSVRNVGSRETEYSLTLRGVDASWYRLPAKLRVPAGETIDSQLVLRPTASASSGVYPFEVNAIVDAAPDVGAQSAGKLTILAPAAEPSEPSQPAPSQARATAAAAAVPPAVALGPETTFSFGPGQITEEAVVTIGNRSRLLEGYSVAVDGLPVGWFRLGASEVRLDPGASQRVSVRLTPRPGSEHPAGRYEFRVRVVPHGSDDAFTEVGGVLDVEGTTAFDARIAPLQAQGRREKYKVTLRNTGTLPVSLWIEGTDREGMCRFDYPPPPNLQPGEERVLPVRVGVRRNRFIGRPETYDFGLRVTPAGEESSAARVFDARLTHQPFLTRRLLRWTVLIAFLVIAVGVIVSLGPGRLLDGSDWMRCRFNGSASFCRPTTRLPRVLDWQQISGPALVALTSYAPTVRTAGRALRGRVAAVGRRAARGELRFTAHAAFERES